MVPVHNVTGKGLKFVTSTVPFPSIKFTTELQRLTLVLLYVLLSVWTKYSAFGQYFLLEACTLTVLVERAGRVVTVARCI